ncbi:MAG: ABC transporter ATP-binding protein [Pseudomonadota bacterium]
MPSDTAIAQAEAGAQPILQLKDLRVEAVTPRGKTKQIVHGINIDVQPGEVVALIGESGAGKSTIGLATLGYARPGCRISGGEVLFRGEDVLSLTMKAKRQMRGKDIAYVAQSAAAAFNPAHTIGSQIIEAAEIHGVMNRSQARERMIELNRQMQLPNPETIGNKFPHQVSGGQLQRLMAVMAMTCGPGLIIFDEPTTAIDVTTQVEVLGSFKDAIANQGASALYVSHDLSVVAQIADRIVVLRYGEIVEEGPTEQIINSPSHDYTKMLMAAARPMPDADGNMEGVAKPADNDQQVPVEDAPLLSIQDMFVQYRDKETNKPFDVLKNINMNITQGEIVGIIGESGSGKSTMARAIAGLTKRKSGTVSFEGVEMYPDVRDRMQIYRQRIQMVHQMPDVAFNPRKTVRHALERPLEFFLKLGPAERRQRVNELMEMVELDPKLADRLPRELSGGQKQRVNLARALAAEPTLVLCDEVTSSLDTVVGAAIIKMIQSLQRKLGITFVFISHDISTVAALADRIAVMYMGEIVELGPTAEVLQPPSHPYTNLLLKSVPEMRTGWLEDLLASGELEAAASQVQLAGA